MARRTKILVLTFCLLAGVSLWNFTSLGVKAGARSVALAERLYGQHRAAAAPVPVAPAMFATLVVTKTADTNGVCNSGVDCSLREAIAAANANAGADTINFAPGVTGTITLTNGQLTIDDPSGGPLTINGPGANVLTVSGNNASRVFEITSSDTATISGLTISNGRVSGGNSGGGIFNQGMLTLTNSTLSGNSTNSATSGAGINNQDGTLTISQQWRRRRRRHGRRDLQRWRHAQRQELHSLRQHRTRRRQ